MKVSIVTVCFNEEKRIGKTIESVLGQTYADIEYILIDGKSSDSTVSIIRSYSDKDKRISYISEKDTGLFNAMNKGIAMANGDYISFMNAGDSLHDETVVERVVGELGDGSADMLCGHTFVFGRKSRVGRIQGKTTLDLENMIRILNMDWVCHQAIFYKTKTIKKYYYDENYPLAADYDLFLRYLKNHRSIIWSRIAICDYHLDGISNDSKYADRILAEDELSIRKNYGFFVFWFCRRIWPKFH